MVQVFGIQQYRSLYELRRIPGRAITRVHATNALVQMQVSVRFLLQEHTAKIESVHF